MNAQNESVAPLESLYAARSFAVYLHAKRNGANPRMTTELAGLQERYAADATFRNAVNQQSGYAGRIANQNDLAERSVMDGKMIVEEAMKSMMPEEQGLAQEDILSAINTLQSYLTAQKERIISGKSLAMADVEGFALHAHESAGAYRQAAFHAKEFVNALTGPLGSYYQVAANRLRQIDDQFADRVDSFFGRVSGMIDRKSSDALFAVTTRISLFVDKSNALAESIEKKTQELIDGLTNKIHTSVSAARIWMNSFHDAFDESAVELKARAVFMANESRIFADNASRVALASGAVVNDLVFRPVVRVARNVASIALALFNENLNAGRSGGGDLRVRIITRDLEKSRQILAEMPKSGVVTHLQLAELTSTLEHALSSARKLNGDKMALALTGVDNLVAEIDVICRQNSKKSRWTDRLQGIVVEFDNLLRGNESAFNNRPF